MFSISLSAIFEIFSKCFLLDDYTFPYHDIIGGTNQIDVVYWNLSEKHRAVEAAAKGIYRS